MSRRTYVLKEAERIVPLLRSIGRELRFRRRAADEIRTRMKELDAPARRTAPATASLETELATHLREIRGAEKELESLGCRLDEKHPLRILIPSPDGDWAYDGNLDDTRFYASPAARAP